MLSHTLVQFTSPSPHQREREYMKRKMADKACESCREWQEHYYWEHMDVRKIRFCKLMTGDFVQGIIIPEKFVSNFSEKITEGFDLKAPSGETWHVGVAKVDSEIFFRSGWEDFAKAHLLQENDLLIFTCHGSSSLKVMIFDASGCEKLASHFVSKTGAKMRKHFHNVVDQQDEQYYPNDCDDTSLPLELVGSPHKASASKKSSGRTKPGSETEYPNSSSYHVKHKATEESDDWYADSNYYYSRTADRQLIDEEKEMIVGLASVQPDNPAFVTVLHKSHVRSKNNFLIVPERFAADHLARRSQEIVLRRPNRSGKKWGVRYYESSTTRGFNCRRWVSFVRDNRLREGHVCVFELVGAARRPTMAVHVLHKAGNRFVRVK